MISGIYCITNLIDNKKYIGQSWNIEGRWHHYNKVGADNRYLLNVIKKYGVNNFKREILIVVDNQEDLDRYEIKIIELYNCCDRNKGYNIRLGGSKGKHSEETKRKISQIRKGKPLSEVHKNRISQGLYKKFQEINFLKDRNYNGINNPFYGKKNIPKIQEIK